MSRTGRFSELPLVFQIGNIASEISRARAWDEQGNQQERRLSVERALELFSLFFAKDLPRGLRREMLRCEEVLAQFYQGPSIYAVTLAELEQELLQLFICLRK